MRLYLAILATLTLWSILSLLFYRAPAGHGPDMVATEVFRFLLPLAIALIVSLFGLILPAPAENISRAAPL